MVLIVIQKPIPMPKVFLRRQSLGWSKAFILTASLLYTKATTMIIAAEARQVFFSSNTFLIGHEFMTDKYAIPKITAGEPATGWNLWVKEIVLQVYDWRSLQVKLPAKIEAVCERFPNMTSVRMDLVHSPQHSLIRYDGWDCESADIILVDTARYRKMFQEAVGDRVEVKNMEMVSYDRADSWNEYWRVHIEEFEDHSWAYVWDQETGESSSYVKEARYKRHWRGDRDYYWQKKGGRPKGFWSSGMA